MPHSSKCSISFSLQHTGRPGEQARPTARTFDGQRNARQGTTLGVSRYARIQSTTHRQLPPRSARRKKKGPSCARCRRRSARPLESSAHELVEPCPPSRQNAVPHDLEMLESASGLENAPTATSQGAQSPHRCTRAGLRLGRRHSLATAGVIPDVPWTTRRSCTHTHHGLIPEPGRLAGAR